MTPPIFVRVRTSSATHPEYVRIEKLLPNGVEAVVSSLGYRGICRRIRLSDLEVATVADGLDAADAGDTAIEAGATVRYDAFDTAYHFVGKALAYDAQTHRYKVGWHGELGYREDWIGAGRLHVVLCAEVAVLRRGAALRRGA